MRFSAIFALALTPLLATLTAGEDPKPGGTPVLVELFSSQG
ncbi:MAG: hypothetical protein AAB074_07150 [Planctomycetota bacterium]